MDDGWIEHNGGDLALDRDTRIMVRYRDGFETKAQHARTAGTYKPNLKHFGNDFDIIAYRVVSE